MRKLGWVECDVVEVDVDDLEATALGIALNRTGELAEWDEKTLASLLDSLKAEDALEGVGFAMGEVDDLLSSLYEDIQGNEDLDDLGPGEPPKEPVTKIRSPVFAPERKTGRTAEPRTVTVR